MEVKELARVFPELGETGLLQEISKFGHRKSFEIGTEIMGVGGEVRFVPLILSGSLRVSREDENGRELYLYGLGKGETCPMSFTCCMIRQRSEICAVVEEKVDIVLIPVDKMDEWMQKYSGWKSMVMMSYKSRFQELMDTIDGLVFRQLDDRLMDYLYQKTSTYDEPVLHKTHQQIAEDLNSSREVISRILKKLEQKGKVDLGRNRIEVL